MANSFFISVRVIDTVNSLPVSDRLPISNALTTEFLLGGDPNEGLTPIQAMLYAMIRHYVVQDTERNINPATPAGSQWSSLNSCTRRI